MFINIRIVIEHRFTYDIAMCLRVLRDARAIGTASERALVRARA